MSLVDRFGNPLVSTRELAAVPVAPVALTARVKMADGTIAPVRPAALTPTKSLNAWFTATEHLQCPDCVAMLMGKRNEHKAHILAIVPALGAFLNANVDGQAFVIALPRLPAPPADLARYGTSIRGSTYFVWALRSDNVLLAAHLWYPAMSDKGTIDPDEALRIVRLAAGESAGRVPANDVKGDTMEERPINGNVQSRVEREIAQRLATRTIVPVEDTSDAIATDAVITDLRSQLAAQTAQLQAMIDVEAARTARISAARAAKAAKATE